jgi:WD40 repeat protein
MIFELAQDFRDTLAAMPKEHPKQPMLELLEQAIRHDIHFIDRHPTSVFQCMWNTCWHDTVSQTGFTEATRSSPQEAQTELDATPRMIQELLTNWLTAKDQETPGFVWVRSTGFSPTRSDHSQPIVLRGHTNSVQSVDFSPDGKQLASCSAYLAPPEPFDPAIPVFYGNSLAPVQLEPVVNPYLTVDNSVRIWDVETGRQIAFYDTSNNPINSLSYAPDGRSIVVASQKGTVYVLDAYSGVELVRCIGHRLAVNRAVFSPDGRLIASASSDTTIGLWNARTGAEVRTMLGHSSSVTCVAFSPDGTCLASTSASSLAGNSDTSVCLWDVATGKQQASFSDVSGITSVVFSPDGQRIAASTLAGTIRVWRLADHAEIARLESHAAPVLSVAISSDGEHIVTASCDRTIRIWSTQDWRQETCLTGHEDFVNCAVVAPTGTRIASASADFTVRLWNMMPSQPPDASMSHPPIHGGDITCFSVSPDGRHAVSGAIDGTVAVWNSRGNLVASFTDHPPNVLAASILAEDDLVLSADRHNIRGRELSSGLERYLIVAGEEDLTAFALTPDRRIAIGGLRDGRIRMWNALSGEFITELSSDVEKSHLSAVFFPALSRVEPGLAINCLDVSRDVTQLAAGHMDGSVRVWSLHSDTWIGHQGHRRAVSCVKFSPDGRYLASGELGGTVLLWDLSAVPSPMGNLRVRAYRGHHEAVQTIAFSDAGDSMVTGAAGRTIAVRDLDSGHSDVLQGHCDITALAGQRCRWLPVVRSLETVFVDSWTGAIIAHFPIVLSYVRLGPDGVTWFGADQRTVCLLTIDVDQNAVVATPIHSELRSANLLASRMHPVEMIDAARRSATPTHARISGHRR